MLEKSQQAFLKEAKKELSKSHPGLTWDEFAVLCNIEPRAFKTYRMPRTSKDYRTMPKLAKEAVNRVVRERLQKTK